MISKKKFNNKKLQKKLKRKKMKGLLNAMIEKYLLI